MNFYSSRKHLKLWFIGCCLLLSMQVFSQTTFTVVCDKTDNKVKVVESTNHSPNFVPVKGGFPFRQVAQNWIKENYPSGLCNPQQVIENNQPLGNNTGNTGNIPTQTTQTPSSIPVIPKTGIPTVQKAASTSFDFKNTSLLFNIQFANLGGEFLLNKTMVPGFELGIDHIFGKKFYFGTGLNCDFYFTDFESKYGYDIQTFLLPRIPVYIGYRKTGEKFTVMFEGGIHINAKLTSLDSEWELPGRTESGNSFDLMGRLKIGNTKIMLEFGTEYWMTGFFEDSDFRMSSTFIGGRFFF